MSFAMTLATVMLFGALLMVGGVFQLLNAFQLKGWKSVLWHVLIALLYIAAGLVIFTDPVFASLAEWYCDPGVVGSGAGVSIPAWSPDTMEFRS